MNRREFFGFSAVAATAICSEAAGQGVNQAQNADKEWRKNIKIITQTPIKSAKPADTIIYGDIYTAYKQGYLAEAIAIKDGKFVYVGSKDGVGEFKGANTKIMDFKDGAITPGFIDGHLHGALGMSEKVLKLDIKDIKGLDNIKKAIRRYMFENPDLKVIEAVGWQESEFFVNGDANSINASMLDDLGDKPIVMTADSHHTEWLNTAALKAAGIDKNTPDIKGGVITRDKDGNPLGVFQEDASLLGPHSPIRKIIPKISEEGRQKVILALQEYLFSLGVTAFMDAGINIDTTDNWIKSFQKLDKEGKIKIHANAAYIIKDTPEALDLLAKAKKLYDETKGSNFEVNTIKIFNDGGAGTAYLNKPYLNRNDGYRGELLWDEDRLAGLVAKANDLGFSVHAHSIGDGSTSMLVRAYEKGQKASKNKDPRNAITHLMLVEPNDIAKMARLKIVAVANMYWHFYDHGTVELMRSYGGDEAVKNLLYLKKFFDENVVVSNASDFPVSEPFSPLAMQMAITRKYNTDTALNPSEIIAINQAFYATTINGAYQLKKERFYGSIEVGKSADFVVLDAHMDTMVANKLGDIKVLKTAVAGQIVYEKPVKKQGNNVIFY